MRITQILETTTAGSVATVAQPMMTQTREGVDVKGLKPVKQLMKGTKKKGPYANSIVEGKVKELISDLKNLTSHDFEKKHKQSKADVRADMKKVNEDDLSEQDLIVIPGQGRLRKTGFVKHDMDQGEPEGHTLKNSLHTIARAASELDERLSVQSEFPEWVSEKIGATKSMMVTVMDYLISSQEMQHDRDNMEEGLGESVSLRDMVNVVDEHYPNYYAELSGSDISDEQFEKKIINAYKKIMQKQGSNAMEGSDRQWSKQDMERLRVATRDFDDIMASDGPEAFKQELIKKRIKTKPMAGPKGVLPEGTQRVDPIVTDALRVMRGPEVSDAVLALKRVLGDRAYNERRGFYSFYVDQIHDMYGQQGVAEGELEEDLSRRGFLRGLGAAALGATALGAASKAQAGQGQNLGNGFVLTTVDVFGGKFKAVLDTQSDIHYIPNRNESGGAIVRSMAPFIMIKNGQTNTAMNVGPAAQAALKKAGLLKGVEEGKLNEIFEPTLDYYKLSNGKTVQVSYRPNVNQSPVPFTDVSVTYVNPALKPQGPSFDSTGVAVPWTSAPDGVKQAIQKFVTQPQQGVAEGEIDTSRMNKQHQDFYNKNPNFKRDDREVKFVGGRLSTKVTPKTAQVTKKPMTPFESIDNAWDAAKKKVSEGLKK